MALHRWLLVVLAACWLASDSQAQTRERPFDLVLQIDCPQQDIRCGDEIPIVFTITNKDPEPFWCDYHTDMHSGRREECELIARRIDGGLVPGFRIEDAPAKFGGLSSGLRQLSTGASCQMTVALNLWARITEPGRYSVTGTYCYAIENKDVKPRKGVLFTKNIRVKSSPIEVEVKPRTREEMGEYIRDLTVNLMALGDGKTDEVRRKREHLAARLAYTCDPRIVPTMLDLLYRRKEPGNEDFIACWAFCCYLPHTEEVRTAVLTAVRSRGLDYGVPYALEHLGYNEGKFAEIIRLSLASDDPNTVHEAVQLAQAHPADEHMPRIIAIATGPATLDERGSAIWAIASHRTDEGVTVLKRLLDDPDPDIRKRASDGVKEAYRRHPIFPEEVDEALTKSLVVRAMDPTCPFRCMAAYAIARTRTAEGVKAVKTLLVDPNADVPLAQTDLGVRTIRDLLHDGDPDLRDRIRIDIDGAYHEYRGRPFRSDDFPAEFQETPEQFKQKVLEGLLKE